MGQPPPDPDEVNAAMRRFALRRFNDVHARLKAKRATYEAEVTPLVAERAACIRELQAAGWTGRRSPPSRRTSTGGRSRPCAEGRGGRPPCGPSSPATSSTRKPGARHDDDPLSCLQRQRRPALRRDRRQPWPASHGARRQALVGRNYLTHHGALPLPVCSLGRRGSRHPCRAAALQRGAPAGRPASHGPVRGVRVRGHRERPGTALRGSLVVPAVLRTNSAPAAAGTGREKW